MIRVGLRAAAAATMVVCVLAPLTVIAQTWPTKAVRIIVPYQAGQGTDVAARYLSSH